MKSCLIHPNPASPAQGKRRSGLLSGCLIAPNPASPVRRDSLRGHTTPQDAWL